MPIIYDELMQAKSTGLETRYTDRETMLYALGGPVTAIVSLVLAGICFGFGTPTLYAMGQTLAGPRAGGKWIAVQNCVGNTAGIVAPVITGFLVDRTGQFAPAFLIAGAIGLLGVLAWGVIVGDIEQIDWA